MITSALEGSFVIGAIRTTEQRREICASSSPIRLTAEGKANLLTCRLRPLGKDVYHFQAHNQDSLIATPKADYGIGHGHRYVLYSVLKF